MKLKFEPLYRLSLVFLALVLGWSLWAGAQSKAATGTGPAERDDGVAIPSSVVLAEGYLTFGLDHIPVLRDNRAFGEPLWKYFASVAYILIALLITRLIDVLTGNWLKMLTARTRTRFDDLLLELMRRPVKVVAFVIFLHIGLSLFDWSPKASSYLSKVLVLVVAGSLTYLCLRVVHLALDFWRASGAKDADQRFDDHLFSVIRKTFKAFIVVVAILVTAQNLGINITAVITSLSIGGLAVGLAAQDTLANLFGAVAVFADKPFRVGDAIRLESTEGTVEYVGLRSTQIRNGDGHLVTIPNKTVGNATITNISRRPNIRTVINLPLVHHTPVEKIERALAILKEVYRGNPQTHDVWVTFNQFAGRNINLNVIHWWKGTVQQEYLAGMQEMNLAVKARFDEEGILLGRTMA